MFEEEYKRANDRIHPRPALLKEMEAKWAAEQAQSQEETGRVVAFPLWARYLGVAAGVILCVGLGMGSVLLYSRSRGIEHKSASADAPMLTAEGAVEMEEAKIVVESADLAVNEAAPEEPFLFAAAPAQGMHRAADEAEVEDAVRAEDMDQGAVDAVPEAAAPETTNAPAAQTQLKAAENGAAKAEQSAYAAGTTVQRDDLVAVFMPTSERVNVVQYANRKMTNVFSLKLADRSAQVKQVFWVGDRMLAVREKNGETGLMRFDVADWKAPRHLRDLTQSGSFLCAGETGGKVFVLSLTKVAEEEPLPWVDGTRMDFDQVLLDAERPGDIFTVITVCDPQGGDGFAAQTALLTKARGAIIEMDRLLLWAGEEETDFYVLGWDGENFTLEAQDTRPGTVLDAGLVGENFDILMQTGDDVTLLTLDRALDEVRTVTAQGAGAPRFAAVYEGGAAVLTDGAFHWISEAGDAAVEMAGDVFTWLAPDRGLVLSADGKLQVVDIVGHEPVARGVKKMKESLALLVEDPSRLAFELEAGRLVFPAGQKVYQFLIDEAGEFKQKGTPVNFGDHNEAEQRELRVLLTEDRILIFYKAGVVVCNQNLAKQFTHRY